MKNYSSRLYVVVLISILLILFLFINERWIIILSLITCISGALSSVFSTIVEKGMKFTAWILGLISQTILLTILFYLVLFPLSLLYKIFHKDSLMLSPDYESYFQDVDREFKKESLENPW
ncbi:MAG: hypothetical protein ACUVTX_12245 [Bacteroidales bacterium]